MIQFGRLHAGSTGWNGPYPGTAYLITLLMHDQRQDSPYMRVPSNMRLNPCARPHDRMRDLVAVAS